MKTSKICKCCGTEFFVPKYRANSAIYCSRKCLGKDRVSILHGINVPNIVGKKPHNFKGVSKHCLHCGKEFNLSPSRLGIKKFCKKECYVDWQKNDGPKNYLKKNGTHIHRDLAVKKIGRPLYENEVVHHIDGNKHNNNLSNLVIMDFIDHINMHSKYKTNPAPYHLFWHISLISS